MSAAPRTVDRVAPDQGATDGTDAGMTLVELLVAMTTFTVLLVVITSGVVALTQVAVRTDNTSTAADDVRGAYLHLDRQVREADAINLPGAVGPDWYVEFRATAVADAAPVCTQWRYRPGSAALQVRRWDQGDTPAEAWGTVARAVSNPTAEPPFALVPTDQVHTRQQLRVTLHASTGTSAQRGRAEIDTVFVARNSSPLSPGGDADADGASDDPVCTGPIGGLAGVRS